ncbi:MAG: polysaccharide deacetylase family protein [Oscillospiraceae bacterium]|nr:polysaccharide deacetylase family protein [Oscillospiraceae bacterium]
MYRCCNVKHFFHLLIIDAVVVAILALFVNTSGCFDTSGADSGNISLNIIMYHSVSNEASVGEYIVSTQAFEQDLQWLRENGYESVLPSELVSYVRGQKELAPKLVMLTFDDGCYNNLSDALPLLEKYDYSAVVSVVGEYTDINAKKDPHVSAYSYLTWGDINNLIDSQKIEIGNHTYSLHKNGERLGAKKMYYETESQYSQMLYADVSKLQNRIYENTGLLPICFAYPYGAVSAESIPVMKELGFLVTLGCEEKCNTIRIGNSDDLYSLGRYNRSGMISTERFMQKVFQ